jgi:hypothetical protein
MIANRQPYDELYYIILILSHFRNTMLICTDLFYVK